MKDKTPLSKANVAQNAEFRDFIADLFAMAAGMQSLRRAIAKRVGLGGTELGILLSLGRLSGHGSVNIRQVADHMHVAAANITTEMNRLESKGLVVKHASEQDSRSVELCITSEGMELLEAIGPNLHMINEALFDQTGDSDISKQRRFFRRVLAGLPDALARLPAPRPLAQAPSRPPRGSLGAGKRLR